MPVFAFFYGRPLYWASLMTQMVKNLLAMWETWVRPLGWEDPLEKGLATHSSIRARKMPWTEEPSGLQSRGSHQILFSYIFNRSNKANYIRK